MARYQTSHQRDMFASQTLLAHNAKTDTRQYEGLAAIHIAAKMGYKDIAQVICLLPIVLPSGVFYESMLSSAKIK